MSESYREQRPLLCDELSDEERFSLHPRRFRRIVYRGRARNTAKGAAAIITNWPEHWSSTLTYWWIGLVMISITLFILYNSVIAFALLPSAHLKPMRLQTMNKLQNMSAVDTSLPHVHMHLIVNNIEKEDFNKYIPYIEIISNRHLNFNYNLIVVLNDTSGEGSELSAEEHNEIAFNSLWNKENNNIKQKIYTNNKINIEHVTLSEYMNKSPLRKHWRYLPHQFTEFLLRAISIWDKGGIAFNPKILTPQSPQAVYIEKIQNILYKYGKPNGTKQKEIKANKHNNLQKKYVKKRVNNIRDIIEVLEHGDGSFNSPQYSLSEAEERNVNTQFKEVENGHKLLSTAAQGPNNEMQKELTDNTIAHTKLLSVVKDNDTKQRMDKEYFEKDVKSHQLQNFSKETSLLYIEPDQITNKPDKLNLLPLFLQFLFHEKPKTYDLPSITTEDPIPNNVTKKLNVVSLRIVNPNESTSKYSLNKEKDNDIDKNKPKFFLTNNVINNQIPQINKTNFFFRKHENDLTIDIKGNILATETACHAFIGTIFSTVVHHTKEETLEDFITAELSIFCKGLLSSCKGIDVIFL